ncbi:MAG: PAS domain-containing sensor histidine kinase [Bacteroidetes bacterium]|nr:MAG: PAS domain-containing sensor histidine kinase [Bacteroidota bacterium]
MVKLKNPTLEFPDKKEEALFKRSFFNDSLPITRVAILLAAFLYAVFGVLDAIFVSDYLRTFLIIRIGIVVPFLLLFILLSFHKLFYRFWQLLLFLAFLVSGVGIALMIALSPQNWSYYGGLMMIFMVGYFFIRLRFIWASIGGWLNLIIFNVLMYSLADVDQQIFLAYNFFYASANFIGMFGSYYFEISGRRNFYLSRQLDQKQRDLENINQNLESTVESRTRELKENEEKYRLIFERSPLGVFHFNDKWEITECNDHFANIIGRPRHLLEGMHLKELSDRRITNAVEKVLKGSKASFEGRYKTIGKGKASPVRILFAPIKRNIQTIGGIGLVEDRSEFIEKQKLEKQIAVAKESVNFKQKFLANMSHEIRTPLTGIIGMIDILSQTRLNNEQMDYLSTLKLTSENLREIINQILDYSKIEAGRLKIKTRGFNFYELINNAQKLYETLCPPGVSLNLYIDPQIPEYIKADDHRVSQIINNILNNAIKFTRKGTIDLLALPEKWLADGALLLRIEVIDTGEGIHPEKINKLFKPFSQLEGTENQYFEGTGLGLSISKELTDLMGGDIGVISEQGKGSTFWFNFKAEKVSREDARKSINFSALKQTGPLNILYAEDKLINQKVVNLILTSLGHKVTIVKNGQEALDKYEPGSFDLILMDIQMPVMDGITATRKLKAKHPDLPPVVGLSANAFEGDKEKYMSQGLDDYLTKPVKKEDFMLLLHKLTL